MRSLGALFALLVCSLALLAGPARRGAAVEPDDPETEVSCASSDHKLAFVNRCD